MKNYHLHKDGEKRMIKTKEFLFEYKNGGVPNFCLAQDLLFLIQEVQK